MIENKINISQALGNRFDVSFYNARFDFVSNSYPSFDLGQLVYINPPVSFDGISDNEEMSFIPMESIDEHNVTIKTLKTIRFREIKGFTKFQEGDLLWAKITPCMQNGKSAIACNRILLLAPPTCFANKSALSNRSFGIYTPKVSVRISSPSLFLLRVSLDMFTFFADNSFFNASSTTIEGVLPADKT